MFNLIKVNSTYESLSELDVKLKDLGEIETSNWKSDMNTEFGQS